MENSVNEINKNSEENKQIETSLIPENNKRSYIRYLKKFWYYIVYYYPILYFGIISYAGSRFGSVIFEKFIKVKLEPNEKN
jgi:hypothetical protein